jgi:MEDS: MEthanogen/methylotroph, DcmR Sensory domain
MDKPVAPISLAGSPLGQVRHVCAFFNNDDQKYRALLPFIEDGLACGDKAVHLLNPDEHQSHLLRLKHAGIDTAGAQGTGQFELQTNTDFYLKNGLFDKSRMLDTFEQMADSVAKAGFPRSRFICQMEWAAENQPYIDDLIEFESSVNEVWSRRDDAAVCIYNLEHFGGEAIIDILRTHPMVIIGGILQQNPFYVPHEVFLRELRERRAKRAARPDIHA